jgi:hypothetical protein
MRRWGTILLCAAALLGSTNPGGAQSFATNVSQKDIDCAFAGIFNSLFSICPSIGLVTEKIVTIPNVGSLRSRTFKGTGTASNRWGYMYRVEVTNNSIWPNLRCVTEVKLNFGPIAPLAFGPNTSYSGFVTYPFTLGTQVGFGAVSQAGYFVTIGFSQPICPGQFSGFFGLASLKPPTTELYSQVHVVVATTLFGSGSSTWLSNLPLQMPLH